MNNIAEKCSNGKWLLWDDCETQGLTCVMKQGEAVCVDIGDNGNNDDDACGGCFFDDSGKYSVFGDMGCFWSSSVGSDNTSALWGLNFNYGEVSYYGRSNYFNVRCVR